MPRQETGPFFEVRVDEVLLAEDLAHASDAAHTAIAIAVKDMKSRGVEKRHLKRCDAEGRDGTQLTGCVKLYIPPPAGRWGAVFSGEHKQSQPILALLAVGERHPPVSWRPSVYEIAHRRLHG